MTVLVSAQPEPLSREKALLLFAVFMAVSGVALADAVALEHSKFVVVMTYLASFTGEVALLFVGYALLELNSILREQLTLEAARSAEALGRSAEALAKAVSKQAQAVHQFVTWTRQEITGLKGIVRDAAGTVSGLRDELRSLGLSEMLTESANRSAEHQKALVQLSQEMKAVDARLTTIDERLESGDPRLGAVAELVRTLASRLPLPDTRTGRQVTGSRTVDPNTRIDPIRHGGPDDADESTEPD